MTQPAPNIKSKTEQQSRCPLRLFYASGPGDNISTYRHWLEGRDDPSEPAVAYSGQFFDVCRDLHARAYVLSTCPREERMQDGNITIEHRSNPARGRHGLAFHLGQLRYGLKMLLMALRFRPDVAIVNEGVHWFLLSVLMVFGIAVVPALHVRMNQPVRCGAFARRWLRLLDRVFFRYACRNVLVASPEIAADLGLDDKSGPPISVFLPLYRRSTFARVPPADHANRPFNIMYVGRVETNKGALDLVDIARIACRQRDDLCFHVCGNGNAVEVLRERIVAAGLQDRFHLHGHCGRDRLMQMYARAHAVIVPTRSEIGEGFNQVTVEAVLAGRPVITSTLCPAVNYVRDAVLVVPPDDVNAYARAILHLADNQPEYVSLQQACASACEQFYDAQYSWGACVRQIVMTLESAAQEKRQPREDSRRVAQRAADSHAAY